MNTIKKVENLTEFLTESVENVVNTVERVHQSALDVPANLLKVVGLSEATAEKVKAKQHQVVGYLYDAIRVTNHEVAHMANEICHGLEEGIEAIENLELEGKAASKKVAAKKH